MKNLTKRKAEQTLRALKARYVDEYGDTFWGDVLPEPKLVENWEWLYGVKKWAIVWEDGPFEWSLSASWQLADEVDGVFAEPINGWSLALYPAD